MSGGAPFGGAQAQMIANEVGNRLRRIQVQDRPAGVLQRPVAGDRDHRRVAGGEQGMAERRAVNLDLGVGQALEALDDQQVDRAHAGDQLVQRRLAPAAQFVDQGPAGRRGDDGFDRAGRAVAVAVLARKVDLEAVMGVLDRRDGKAPSGQHRQQPGDQRRLPAALPARNPDDPPPRIHGANVGRRRGGGNGEGHLGRVGYPKRNLIDVIQNSESCVISSKRITPLISQVSGYRECVPIANSIPLAGYSSPKTRRISLSA